MYRIIVVYRVLFAVLLMSTLFQSPVQATGPRIVNGTLTGDFPSTGALLNGASADTAVSWCTGTLIGCETFIVAAHCVEDDLTPGNYYVFLQHAGFFAVTDIAVHPDYSFPVADVAVLKLATPVTGIAPTPLNLTVDPPVGTAGIVTGFGRSGGSASDYGIKRTGAVTIAPCSGFTASNPTSVCWDFAAPLGPPGSDSNTCNGDSGGPLFIDLGCGPVLAGITSGGESTDCLPNDSSYDTNIYYYQTWIQAEGGADLANQSCGVMPQAGDPATTINVASGTLDGGTPQANWTVNVPVGTQQLRVALNGEDDGANNFDLYVKFGSAPTLVDFDCKADSSTMFGYCDFVAPGAGTWHLLINRVQGSGIYQATSTIFPLGMPAAGTDGQTCDDDNECSDPDTCSAGQCNGTALMDGSVCDDGSECTAPDSCQAGSCTGTAAPQMGCLGTTTSGRSQLFIKNNPTTDLRDKMIWKWAPGDTTTLGDFGNPLATSNLQLCVFDYTATVPSVALEAEIPAGAGWSSSATGYKYSDPSLGGDGISKVQLKSGSAGKAKIIVRGRGANLDMPATPLQQDPNVLVQLSNEVTCWEASYSTFIKNDTVQFRAKGD